MEPWIGLIRLVDGRRQEGGHPGCAWLSPPLHPAPGRESERFAMVLDLTGPAPSRLYRDLREVAAQAFWSTPGSPVAALRRAAIAAHRALVRFNAQVPPESRCIGSMACAALRANEGFVACVGPAWVRRISDGQGESMPERALPSLGTRPYMEVALTYFPIQPGMTLLLSAQNPLRFAALDALDRVLQREGEDILDGLEQLAEGETLTALVVRWVEEPSLPPPPPRRRAPRRPAEVPTAPPSQPAEAPSAPPPEVPEETPPVPAPLPWEEEEAGEEEKEETGAGLWEPEPVAPSPVPEEPGVQARWGGVLRQGAAALGGALTAGARGVWSGLRAGVSALGRGGRSLFRRTLPGRERRRAIRTRSVRLPPAENPRRMAALALVILVLVALVTLLVWLRYGQDVRRGQALSQAMAHLQAAQQATAPDEARPHWEAILALLAEYYDPDAQALRTLAQDALDGMDGIVRVTPTLMADLGAPGARYRMVAWERGVVVLQDGQRVQHIPIGGESRWIPVPDSPPLIDIAPSRNALHSGGSGGLPPGLLMLGTEGHLWAYDQRWQESRSLTFPVPPGGHEPVAMATYEGRLYLLDPAAGQIWRYVPQNGEFRQEAEPYFSPGLPLLTEARDMAIDGNIYVLFADGGVARYYQGEARPFAVTGVPTPTARFVALAVNPQMADGPVYLADGAAGRVVVLRPDGAFCAQLRAPGEEFRNLKAIALAETGDQFFALAEGRIYRFSLPSLSCR